MGNSDGKSEVNVDINSDGKVRQIGFLVERRILEELE